MDRRKNLQADRDLKLTLKEISTASQSLAVAYGVIDQVLQTIAEDMWDKELMEK